MSELLKFLNSSQTITFRELANRPLLCNEIQLALVNEALLSRTKLNTAYDDYTENALVNFKRNHSLTGGNLIGPTTTNYLLKAFHRATPSIITQTVAESIFCNPIYPNELVSLNNTLVKYDITSLEDRRHFLSQCAHESGGMRWLVELASGDDYEYRVDLGNTPVDDEDGPKYKGVSPLQMTGRYNYERFSKDIKDPLVVELGVNYVASKYIFEPSGFWWKDNDMSHKINTYSWNCRRVSAAVNGADPANGLNDRLRYYDLACKHLK